MFGALLFVITFLLNLAGHWYVNRLRNKLKGGAPAKATPTPAAAGGKAG